jgi:hypothetical protein
MMIEIMVAATKVMATTVAANSVVATPAATKIVAVMMTACEFFDVAVCKSKFLRHTE